MMAIRVYRTTPTKVTFPFARETTFPRMARTISYVYSKVHISPEIEDAVAEYYSFGRENVTLAWRHVVPHCCSAPWATILVAKGLNTLSYWTNKFINFHGSFGNYLQHINATVPPKCVECGYV